jgi:aspartokinase/homoserine dehydrogenase 1
LFNLTDSTLHICRICCPLQVPEAVCLPSLTYHEAWELSYFGANVLHPRTTLPAMKYSIPIAIRNFFNLTAPGAAQDEV